MARRERPAGGVRGPERTPLNAPFADLKMRLRAVAPPAASPAPPDAAPTLFARAMEGVVPLPRGGGARIDGPAPAATVRPPVSEEAEALAALSDLVRGEARFEVGDTREYVEGAIVGLDPRLVRRLRRGDFAWQAHLDLHGMTSERARHEVDEFLRVSVRAGHRCVLIVHGRGHNSRDQTPVLKDRLKGWLARGRAARAVLAFTSARPCDGGAGALYVLLRRDRRRRPIRVTEGAKR
jgi:DNA-nicking Smr family endonuclease